ncbi:MAG: hypothetical protein IJU31_05360 [Synergistaceae bacterium]|nr:hypothetical protein [Synergistaceae bacterium]
MDGTSAVDFEFDERHKDSQAVMAKNMAEVKAMLAEIQSEIKVLNIKIDGVEIH